MKALSVSDLSKQYKNGVQALKSVNFEVNKGDFFALLGPNGAGKTTAIGIITSLVNKTSGSIQVFDCDIDHQLSLAKSYLGVVPQEINLNLFDKCINTLVNQAGFYGIPRAEAKNRAEDYLKQMNLWDKRNSNARDLSGGMKRRLDLGLSLVHSPEVLFLDEPTTGLDPGSRRVLWDEIKRLRDSGVTIILTTQYLEEADELADRISIIDQGLVVAEGSPDELKSLVGGDVITFSFTDEESVLKANSLIEDSEIENSELRVTVENGAKKIPPLFAMLSENNIEVVSVSASKPTLDDVFLQVTGYRLEGAEDETEENKEEVS